MGNTHQLFTSGRDQAPSLQFWKGDQHCNNIHEYVLRMSTAFQLTVCNSHFAGNTDGDASYHLQQNSSVSSAIQQVIDPLLKLGHPPFAWKSHLLTAALDSVFINLLNLCIFLTFYHIKPYLLPAIKETGLSVYSFLYL